MGAEDILNFKLKSLSLQVIAPPRLSFKLEEKVYANFNMERAHFFDPETDERCAS
jgi:hypothetical protein